ncbi:ubiquitin carboxyl-terminal hydrolase 8-like [Clytia hemisphaerica]
MDIRETIDFNTAKIQHGPTINIPPDLLQTNSTQNSVERYLSKDTWEVWITRFEKQYIIIVNETFNEEQEPGELLMDKSVILQEILCKAEAEYKVMILKGGIQKWVLHYPTMTINPEHIRKTKPVSQDLDVSALLESLAYPTLASSLPKQELEEEVQPPTLPNTTVNKPSEVEPEDKLTKMRRMLSEESNDKNNANITNQKVVYPSLPNGDSKTTPTPSTNTDHKETPEKAVTPNKPIEPIKPLVNLEQDNDKTEPPKPFVNKAIEETKNSIKKDDFAEPNISHDKETLITPNKKAGKLGTTPGLPYGWVKKVDQNSGKVYYIDHNTKTTHWVPPDFQSNNVSNNLVNKQLNMKTLDPTNQNLKDSSNIPKATSNITPTTITTPKAAQNALIKPPTPQNQVSTQSKKTTPKPEQSNMIPPNIQNGAAQKPQVPALQPPQNTPHQTIPKQLIPPQPSSNVAQQPKSTNNTSQQPVTLQQPTKPILKQHPPPPVNQAATPQNPMKPKPPSLTQPPKVTQSPSTPTNVPQAPKNTVPATSRYTTDSLDLPKQPSLKRSLSSPNLAENFANLNKNKPKTPIVDRGSKPSIPSSNTKPTHLIDRASKPISASRLRNLSPVYGSQGMSLTGLKNLGNTCYMNSVLQCLVNTPPLVRYFSSGLYEKDLNAEKINTNPLKGVIAREFAFIMKVLVSGTYRSVSPIDFKLALGGISRRFLTYEQQDSHEVLLIVLDGLHNDVNKAKTRSVIPKRDNNQLSDEQAADQEWKDNIINNDSLVFNLFQGQFRSTVTCLTCRYQSKTFNTFNCLHLQLPVTRVATLAQCLELFVKPEKIDSWHCERCKCDRSAAKTIELWKLPLVLIVQLKRFRCEGIWTNKVQTAVDYPVNNWNLSQYVTGPSKRASNYNLYGIINHSGSFESGHYTARCKNANTGGGWFLYNDERISELNTIKTKEAYVLLYTAVNFEDYVTKR